jgi:hypothetical protein
LPPGSCRSGPVRPDPERTDDPRDFLTAEGVILSRSGKALAQQRMTASELAAAADLETPDHDGAGADHGVADTANVDGETNPHRTDGAPAGTDPTSGPRRRSGGPAGTVAPATDSGTNGTLTYAERVRGCLLGGALGDALGAGVEFLSLAEIRRQHGPGVVGPTAAYGVVAPLTDDTQMTLFTAEGLIRASVRSRSRGIVDPPSVLWRPYQRWRATQRDAASPTSVGRLVGGRLAYLRPWRR